ncbi:unnamed protein product [Didymodactylos carnosus]|uniref:Secreted protein n=1 Tax=Didymodactylos carnosus TaxID=1234261 RepID=A0A816C0N1_9BILA|nr:unnamed protein product [Didymodactylos carnosus]CAF4502402.1 unnamed protein product [Didymodactylos carnosus]
MTESFKLMKLIITISLTIALTNNTNPVENRESVSEKETESGIDIDGGEEQSDIMQIDNIGNIVEERSVIVEDQKTNSEHDNDSDSDSGTAVEDTEDRRTKFNFGMHSCLQPID